MALHFPAFWHADSEHEIRILNLAKSITDEVTVRINPVKFFFFKVHSRDLSMFKFDSEFGVESRAQSPRPWRSLAQALKRPQPEGKAP